jgi:Macrocin-O-methyltransferase (TylF)
MSGTGNRKPQPFDAAARDRYYWEQVEQLVKRRGYSLRDVLQHFPAYLMRRDLTKFLSHSELFKHVVDLPGCVVELGIYRGRSFFTWSHLMETYCPGDRSRMVFGFDHFEGLKEFSAQDGAKDASKTAEKVEGGWKATREEIELLVELHNLDNLIPGARRCELVAGDVRETIPAFLEAHPGLRISLLHFDMDLYEPTYFALEQLYPLVVAGGVVCFDEYGLIPWQGETRAVDDYFAKLDKRPAIRKHPFTATPHGYLIKDAPPAKAAKRRAQRPGSSRRARRA